MVVGLVLVAGYLTSEATTGVLPRLLTSPRPFLGARHVISEVAAAFVGALFFALLRLFVLLVARLLVRRETLAIITGAILLGIPPALGLASSVALIPFAVLVQAIWFAVLARVGLVATVMMELLVFGLLTTFPFVWSTTTWYSGVGFVGIALVAALAIAAFRVATAPHMSEARAPLRSAT
jgi:hypothetical protein